MGDLKGVAVLIEAPHGAAQLPGRRYIIAWRSRQNLPRKRTDVDSSMRQNPNSMRLGTSEPLFALSVSNMDSKAHRGNQCSHF